MKKIGIALLSINALQFLVSMGIWIVVGTTSLDKVNNSLYIAVGLMLLCNVITIIGLYIAMRYKNDSLEENIKNLEQLNTTMRMQRHDYLNHFQVIYGLMELGEYKEAKSYLEPVFQDIQKVSMALKTAHPAINALLQVKLEAAGKKGIDLYLEIRSDIRFIPMEPWNLCKILANILDNSITALTESKEPSKRIHLEIWEDASAYYFRISNNGPVIPSAILPEIFKQGVSSKKEEGHGMGLYIVNKLVREAKGTIEVDSFIEKTTFSITLPKKVE